MASVGYSVIERWLNIRFQRPEMSMPSMTACSFSRMRSTLISGWSLMGASRVQPVDAQQPSHEVGQLGDDAVELLGHAQAGHGVEVDPVDGREVDVDHEGVSAHAPEAQLVGDLDHGRAGRPDAQVDHAAVGPAEVEVLDRSEEHTSELQSRLHL